MNQPQGFMPMPVIQMQPMSDSIGRGEDNTPPARVIVGLKVLNELNHKWNSKIVVNDISHEEYPGPKPTKDENLTYTSALRMFRQYFDGELAPDEQESYRRKSNADRERGGGTISACPLCAAISRVNPQCDVCHGLGRVINYPIE